MQFQASTLQLRGNQKLPAILQDHMGNVLLFNGKFVYLVLLMDSAEPSNLTNHAQTHDMLSPA